VFTGGVFTKVPYTSNDSNLYMWGSRSGCEGKCGTSLMF
jgi:hypothetical protein